jgi:hypothetical protein
MNIIESTAAYESWLRAELGKEAVETDIGAKHAKMSEDVFPFLRATYWRWAETILDVCPELAGAPSVLAVGDIHLENYGTWRDNEGRLIWGVNDFDEAADMPYALDLVRLGTSALLGCPHFDTRADICDNILRAYERGLADPHPIILDEDVCMAAPAGGRAEQGAAAFLGQDDGAQAHEVAAAGPLCPGARGRDA